MLSQPATKIFLRTSEPHAAKWIADTIGDIEIERLRESRSRGRGGQHSYGLERQVEPLVMASEISGPRGPAWLSQDGQSRRPSQLPLHRPAEDRTRVHRAGAAQAGIQPSTAAAGGAGTKSSPRDDRPRTTAASGREPQQRTITGGLSLEEGFQPLTMITISKPLSAGAGAHVSRGRIQQCPRELLHGRQQIRGHWHGQLRATVGTLGGGA